MNTKRWLAIGLTVVVFFSSIMISWVGNALAKEVDQASLWDTMMSETLSENVLREGLSDERIAVIEVSGTIIQGQTSYFDTALYDHQKLLGDLDKIKDE